MKQKRDKELEKIKKKLRNGGDAIRLKSGSIAIFSRNEASGALRNGTLVVKSVLWEGDSISIGHRGVVLGSEPLGEPPPDVAKNSKYMYFVLWNGYEAPAATWAEKMRAATLQEILDEIPLVSLQSITCLSYLRKTRIEAVPELYQEKLRKIHEELDKVGLKFAWQSREQAEKLRNKGAVVLEFSMLPEPIGNALDSLLGFLECLSPEETIPACFAFLQTVDADNLVGGPRDHFINILRILAGSL